MFKQGISQKSLQFLKVSSKINSLLQTGRKLGGFNLYRKNYADNHKHLELGWKK